MTFTIAFEPSATTEYVMGKQITKLCNLRSQRDPVDDICEWELYCPWQYNQPWIQTYDYIVSQAGVKAIDIGTFMFRPAMPLVAPTGYDNLTFLLWAEIDGLCLSDPSVNLRFGHQNAIMPTQGHMKVFRLTEEWPSITIKVTKSFSMNFLRTAVFGMHLELDYPKTFIGTGRSLFNITAGKNAVFNARDLASQLQVATTITQEESNPWSINIDVFKDTDVQMKGYIDVAVFAHEWTSSLVLWHASSGGNRSVNFSTTAYKSTEFTSSGNVSQVIPAEDSVVSVATPNDVTEYAFFNGELAKHNYNLDSVDGISRTVVLAGEDLSAYFEVDTYRDQNDTHLHTKLMGGTVLDFKYKKEEQKQTGENEGHALSHSLQSFYFPPMVTKFYGPFDSGMSQRGVFQAMELLETVGSALIGGILGGTSKEKEELGFKDVIDGIDQLMQHMIPQKITGAGLRSNDTEVTHVICDDSLINYIEGDKHVVGYDLDLFRLCKSMYAYRTGSLLVRLVLGGNTQGGYSSSAWVTRATRVGEHVPQQTQEIGGVIFDNDLRALVRLDGIQNPQKEMFLPYNVHKRRISCIDTAPVGQMIYLVKSAACTSFVVAHKDYKLEADIGCPCVSIDTSTNYATQVAKDQSKEMLEDNFRLMRRSRMRRGKPFNDAMIDHVYKLI
eukprot:NODE_71_length_2644_cov_848.767245_g55_i0.p1 GENE.NODE_71_length_2644_cov_848.767245_g55_i0~~NODE_71_length_2644_cov_848.767245_g55_i0.p1  ORF type:complete len:668 (+),score=-44.56 NODE_71_length_2644_cov_848.767245_g55_i0:87-2090(+)